MNESDLVEVATWSYRSRHLLDRARYPTGTDINATMTICGTGRVMTQEQMDLVVQSKKNARRRVISDLPMCRVCPVLVASRTESGAEPRGHRPSCHHRLYGMSCEEEELLLDRAQGRCELCGGPPTRSLVHDHDHVVGRFAVRGLVCESCNGRLGAIDAGIREPGPAELRYFASAWYLTRAASAPMREEAELQWLATQAARRVAIIEHQLHGEDRQVFRRMFHQALSAG